jgi:hypothetical protein
VAEATQVAGGYEAIQLRVAEQYIQKFGELANATDTTIIVPASIADVAGMLGTAMNIVRRTGPNGNGGAPAAVATPPESPFRTPPPGWAKPGE